MQLKEMEEAGEIPTDDDEGRATESGRQTDLDKDEQMAIGHQAGGQVRPQLEVVPTIGIDNTRRLHPS